MDAIQFLKRRMKVWCKSRVRWERDNLYLLPSGDFTDDEGRLHRREHHTAYVTLEDAILAIRMVEEKFLADKETELQRLESENYTFYSLKHKVWFGFSMIGTALLLMPSLLNYTPEIYQFLAFLMCAGLCG